MFSLLFRNRRFALAWAALTLVSVAIFTGEDGGAERLTQSAGQVQTQRKMLESRAVPQPALPPPSLSENPAESERPLLWAVPGSSADPDNPQIGDVFLDPVSGQQVRAVRREDAGIDDPALAHE